MENKKSRQLKKQIGKVKFQTTAKEKGGRGVVRNVSHDSGGKKIGKREGSTHESETTLLIT